MLNLALKELIEKGLPGSIVESFDMTGTGDHLAFLVASDHFEGKKILEQHRAVMDILRAEFDGPLHAVKLKTMTLKQYQERKGNE